MLALRSKTSVVVILIVVCATVACSDAPPREDAAPSPSSPTVDDEYLQDMCSRQVRAFGWVFPLRPTYKGSKPKLKRAQETVRKELKELKARGYEEDSDVADYLEELSDLAKILRDRVNDKDIAEIQLRYSLMAQTVAKVYELSIDAGLPIDCRLEFDSEEASLLFFQADAAEICRLAHQQIVNAVDSSTLLRDAGRAYLQLADGLRHAHPEKLELAMRERGRKLISIYRRAGKTLLASQKALGAGNQAASAAAVERYDRYTEEARKVARSMGLIFCEKLLPVD